MTLDEAQLSAEILVSMLRMLSREAFLPGFERESALRLQYGKAEVVRPSKNGELHARSALVLAPGRDIYGLEKASDVRYFACKRCERSIAGHRFAAHVSRCTGRGRRAATETDF